VRVDDWLGGFTPGGQRGGRGRDVQANVTITLDEAYSGTRKAFEFEVEEPCPTCHGAGNVGGKPCGTCGGSGWQRGRHQVDVKIPAGVRTGQKVRVSGQGAGGGDLYLAVTVAPHREFERRGDDIQLAVPITAPEAALGVTLEIPTLRGKVSMKIPPATSSGRTFRLPGYGMPKPKGGGHGNQLVTVRIVMPADLRPEERELYEKLKALRSDSPRGGYAQG
jgi:DnaJ-class molecular chaperone